MASMVMLFIYWGILGTALQCLTSCDAENSISKDYLCQFTFFCQNHSGNTLEIALKGLGSYTFVSVLYDKGWYIKSSPNDKRNYTEKIKITTAIEIQELKKTCLGANNGIIIGHTNFGGIVAYDRQCPNCIKNYGGTNYPLEWNTKDYSKVVCKKFHRTYELENGIVENKQEGDVKLMKYPISYYNAVDKGMVISAKNRL